MILVTGGAGYIGSHTCVELLNAGFNVLIADNLSKSNVKVIDRINDITGMRPDFIEIDLCDMEKTEKLFWEHPKINAVIHFAGFKVVDESVKKPLKYYMNNLGSTLSVLNAMKKFNVKKIVFSSSASVYGETETVPIKEGSPQSAKSPDGSTKITIEKLIQQIGAADPDFKAVLLRYFNPIGAHKSGLIGEDPRGEQNSLVSYMAQVAIGKRDHLKVYGNDYDTSDGTGIRDYIHVVDLAKGHLAALHKLEDRKVIGSDGCFVYNLGTGIGYSVLEVKDAFEKANGVEIPHRFYPRRLGDVARLYADPAKAKAELNWAAVHGISEMCADVWHWQKNNPRGYE